MDNANVIGKGKALHVRNTYTRVNAIPYVIQTQDAKVRLLLIVANVMSTLLKMPWERVNVRHTGPALTVGPTYTLDTAIDFVMESATVQVLLTVLSAFRMLIAIATLRVYATPLGQVTIVVYVPTL